MMTINIPQQLQNPEFRFVLLGKWNIWTNSKTKEIKIVDIKDYQKYKGNKDWKPHGKTPFESKWQTDNAHNFDDLKLINHQLNFGVIGGYGNLRILDIDDTKLAEEFEKKLNTYTVKTGSGGRHFYFISDYETNHVLVNQLGELRANKYQVVSAPCQHPSGNFYEVINDVPIAKISSDELLNLIKPYLREEQPTKEEVIEPSIKITKKEDTSRSGLEYRKAIALFRTGKKRTEVHKELLAYKKYADSQEDYRNRTLDNAENFVLQETTEKNKQNVEKREGDLATFIFDEDEIIQTRVFSSHLLNDNIFGFGLLLPREEDIINKKQEVLGQHQVWRGITITSEHRGLVVSKWFQTAYKINFEEIPYEMRLRWELKDIDDFLHNPKQTKINGKDLFDSIKNQYDYYLYFRSKEWYKVHSLWDMGTYVHQLFSAFPLFENRGLSGTAKTKTMLVSSYITLNGTDIMTNPSESTLFRETESLRPTKYIDEAEKLFKFTKEGMEADNRVELINSSYTRNGSVPRQEKIQNKYITKWYHTYSPTMISSINGLYGSTENRAITQIHTKSPDNDIRGERDPEDDINNKLWKTIRNNCYRWTLENWKEIYNEYLNFEIKTNLKKRDLQIWKPLLVIAKVIDEKELLPEIITFAEKLSIQRKNDNLVEGSLDYKYLSCLNYLLLNNNSNKIYLDSIRERYNLMYGTNEEKKSNKSISVHLDKLGFKELRDKDRYGAYYQLTKFIFDEIINPLTNDFIEIKEKSSQSSQSSQSLINTNKISDECMMNGDDYNNKNNNNKCDECDESDENDESPKQEGIINTNKIKEIERLKEELKKIQTTKTTENETGEQKKPNMERGSNNSFEDDDSEIKDAEEYKDED